MCAGSAAADPLSQEDQAFIMASVGTVKVTHECPGYELVPGALVKYGDRAGADTERIWPAILEAVRINANMDYDRSKLIPEVTRLVNVTADTLIDHSKKDNARFCKHWTDFYVGLGLIRRKR